MFNIESCFVIHKFIQHFEMLFFLKLALISGKMVNSSTFKLLLQKSWRSIRNGKQNAQKLYLKWACLMNFLCSTLMMSYIEHCWTQVLMMPFHCKWHLTHYVSSEMRHLEQQYPHTKKAVLQGLITEHSPHEWWCNWVYLTKRTFYLLLNIAIDQQCCLPSSSSILRWCSETLFPTSLSTPPSPRMDSPRFFLLV